MAATVDPKTLNAFRDVLDAVVRLVNALGVGPFVLLVVFLVAAAIAYRIYRDRRLDRKVDAIVQEKEKEIVRLSEVNRELRTTLLRIKGFPEHVLRKDAEDSARNKEKGDKK